MKESYDFIVSLGGNCSVAMQSTWRNKRPFALGLDWTCMPDEKPIDYLVGAFATRFADFALEENLVDISSEYPKSYTSPVYLDKVSGYHLPHQFAKYGNEPGWYSSGGQRLKRRVERMFREVAASKDVLFVLSTSFPFDDDKARLLHAAVCKAFPGVRCDMKVMMFGSDRHSVVEDDGLEIQHVSRSLHLYDLYQTSAIWSFLDDIEVKQCMYGPLSRWDRFMYRIWKHIGKRLKRRGAKLNFVFK